MKRETFSTLSIQYHQYQSHTGYGMLTLARVILMTIVAIYLSNLPHLALWLLGQFIFSLTIFQWFVLMHDFGHNNFFKSSAANWVWGHIASIFCLVPFTPWKYIHTKHHVWTGWHDKDPTMESTLPKSRSTFQRFLARFAWKYWLPLLSLSFSFKNFWNLPRLFRLFPATKEKVQFLFSGLLLIMVLLISFLLIPQLITLWALGYFLFLCWSDPILISQHTHIPQRNSQGQQVKPIPVYEQGSYTRALHFSPFISKYILLKFDSHITHHIWPTVPCYFLDRLILDRNLLPPENSFTGWQWIKTAKQLPGDELLFSNREVSKWPV